MVQLGEEAIELLVAQWSIEKVIYGLFELTSIKPGEIAHAANDEGPQQPPMNRTRHYGIG